MSAASSFPRFLAVLPDGTRIIKHSNEAFSFLTDDYRVAQNSLLELLRAVDYDRVNVRCFTKLDVEMELLFGLAFVNNAAEFAAFS